MVGALTAASLLVVHQLVVDRVAVALQQELERTAEGFHRSLEERSVWLRAQARVVADDPRFTATLDIPNPDAATLARTVVREARRFQSILGSDLFEVTDPAGAVLARVEMHPLDDAAVAGSPEVRRAVAGAPARGVWMLGGERFAVASVPVRERAGVAVHGALVVGYAAETERAAAIPDLLATASASEVVGATAGGPAGDAVVRDLQHLFDCDLVALVDAGGHPVAGVLRHASIGGGAVAAAGVRAALAGREAEGLGGANGLVQTVTVPVWVGDRSSGTLTTGFAMDDALARQLRESSDSEVSFLRGGRIVASSLEPARRQQLAAVLPALLGGAAHGPRRAQLGGESYLTLVTPLAGGDAGDRAVVQGSFDRATAFLHRLERALLLLGAGVLGVAALTGFVGARRLARPLEELVGATERLAAGDLDYRLEATSSTSSDACAQSFDRMAGGARGLAPRARGVREALSRAVRQRARHGLHGRPERAPDLGEPGRLGADRFCRLGAGRAPTAGVARTHRCGALVELGGVARGRTAAPRLRG